MKRVKWIEQGLRDECVTKTLSIDEAIAQQKAAAAAVRPDFVYETDDQALGDFLAVHWAWIEVDA